MRLGVIFDGVIHDGIVPAAGATEISGGLVPGARAFLGLAARHADVLVLSPRLIRTAGDKAVRDWCRRNLGDLTDELRFVAGFPDVDILIGTESLRFSGLFPTVAELRKLRRWTP